MGSEMCIRDRAWRCQHTGKGCPPPVPGCAPPAPAPPPLPFDCTAGFANWTAEWSVGKRTLQDCDAGFEHWQAGGSLREEGLVLPGLGQRASTAPCTRKPRKADGPVWPCLWAVSGLLGPFWALFGQRWALLAHFGPFWRQLRAFWPEAGPKRPEMGQTGPSLLKHGLKRAEQARNRPKLRKLPKGPNIAKLVPNFPTAQEKVFLDISGTIP